MRAIRRLLETCGAVTGILVALAISGATPGADDAPPRPPAPRASTEGAEECARGPHRLHLVDTQGAEDPLHPVALLDHP